MELAAGIDSPEAQLQRKQRVLQCGDVTDNLQIYIRIYTHTYIHT